MKRNRKTKRKKDSYIICEACEKGTNSSNKLGWVGGTEMTPGTLQNNTNENARTSDAMRCERENRKRARRMSYETLCGRRKERSREGAVKRMNGESGWRIRRFICDKGKKTD